MRSILLDPAHKWRLAFLLRPPLTRIPKVKVAGIEGQLRTVIFLGIVARKASRTLRDNAPSRPGFAHTATTSFLFTRHTREIHDLVSMDDRMFAIFGATKKTKSLASGIPRFARPVSIMSQKPCIAVRGPQKSRALLIFELVK